MPTPRWMPNLGSNQPPMKGTDNSDNQITYEIKTGSAYELASQPACNYADDYYDQKTFA
jgi:hypothetical protein